jgi:zona occludens toxin (predicted ATPase)
MKHDSQLLACRMHATQKEFLLNEKNEGEKRTHKVKRSLLTSKKILLLVRFFLFFSTSSFFFLFYSGPGFVRFVRRDIKFQVEDFFLQRTGT